MNFEYEFNSMRSTVWKYFKYVHNENLALMPEQIKAHEESILVSSHFEKLRLMCLKC